ncbi:hypothetical protein [Runella slithyformis]|uniref:Uncharacterized protein n=1 Tax=Runella slithyformis (strain ATCC 29530 / DSM 19594 / LMG 11500 / NCIMB 11436 / LSU 4) TaxID=761193 RepID=A0A7U3ZRQ2_RUNSL|nr:hypothetical protein [Runella slithyformis]AEI52152.1 hypothetical protein Runsl_5855 [Runella slithyformis DSM 19594]
MTGYISATGKIVFPTKTVSELAIDFNNASFKIGTQEGKRKVKSLYLILSSIEEDAFQFEKAPKGYTLSLAILLKKIGIDFSSAKYSFTIESFDYEGSTGLELQLNSEDSILKAPYMGKPRGRKPKALTA